MKNRLLFLFAFLLSATAHAQPNETTIADTAHTRLIILKRDTLYTLTNNPAQGRHILYFDPQKTKQAFAVTYAAENGTNMYTDTLWDIAGNIRATRNLSAHSDTLFENDLYRNGSLRRERISVWRKYSSSWDLQKDNSYFENGQPTGTPIDHKNTGVQHLVTYYETGEKWQDYNWQNGVFVGNYKEYYENGEPKRSGQYAAKVSTEQKAALKEEGIKTGKWKEYDSFGRVVKEEVYENGKLVKVREVRH